MSAPTKIAWEGSKQLRRMLVPVGDLVPHPENPRRGELPEHERAYLAGLLDGEGCISVSRHRDYRVSRSTDREFYESYHARVQVSNTDRRLLDWIATRFGGKVRENWRSQHLRRPTEKPVYSWQRDSRKAETVLRAALPYLIGKRRQAELALALIETCTNRGRNGLPPELLAFRAAIFEEMHRLNRRGRGDG